MIKIYRMFVLLKFPAIFVIFFFRTFFFFGIQQIYAQDTKQDEIKEIKTELDIAKELALKFESNKSNEITSKIRKNIIHKCKDKKFLKLYAEAFIIDGISLHISGKVPEALRLFKTSVSFFPEIKEYIRTDEKIPHKIRDEIIKIEPERNTVLVEIFSEGEIFINGEKICQNTCQVNIKTGMNIICKDDICVEKEIRQNEKIFFQTNSISKRSFTKTALIIGIPVAIAGTATAVILLSLKEKKSQGLRIIIFE